MSNNTTPKKINARQLARKGIIELGAYVPGKPIEDVNEEYGLEEVIKLASNECQLPLPEGIFQAIAAEAKNLSRYPDGYCRKLRGRLAGHLDVPQDCLLFGNGAEECIRLIAQAFLNPGDNSLIPSPIFDAYDTAVRLAGAQPVRIPLANHRTDLEEMLNQVNKQTKIVWLCSPTNPSGTIITRNEFDDFLERLPGDVLVVLDEAYFEYVSTDTAAHATDYLFRDQRVIGLRTFSKAYGLAGLRIGYILAHPSVIEIITMVKLPFNVNILAQAAAIRSLDESEFFNRHIDLIREERAYLTKALEDRKMAVVPSDTNFLFVEMPINSDFLFKKLLPLGIIIRPGSLWQMPNYIRLTVGTREQNDKFLSAMDIVLTDTK
jgi:histidinol-phosphate aminotransferase